jgi:hypothetical protein
MATVVLFMLQPRPISISLDAVILALGGLPALRLPVSARNSQTSSTLPSPPEPLPGLDEMLSALPFPTALVSPDGQPLSINAEATHRLEDGCPSRLTSPLRALARRVADGRESEAVHMTLVEGQPLLRLHASPLLKRAQRAGRGAQPIHSVPLLAPPGLAAISLDLTQLVAHELRPRLASTDGFGGVLCQT